MAAPTYVLSESPTTTGVYTDNVPTIAFASINAASTNVLSANNPIAPGAYSYEKYLAIKCTGSATTQASSFSFYFPNTPQDSAGSSANVTISYDAVASVTFQTPVNTASSKATTNVTGNQSAPGQTLTFTTGGTSGNYSAYMCLQLLMGASNPGGPIQFSGSTASPLLFVQYSWS
jgi:hypothetical protein